MSVYVCEDRVFAYLVHAATSHRLSECDGGSIRWSYTPTGAKELRGTSSTAELLAVASMLKAANVASYNHRYREESLAEPIAISSLHEVFATDPVQVLKACNCLEYQSCEHPVWETSEAKDFLDRLRNKAIRALPGYEESVWGAPRSTNLKMHHVAL